MITANQTKNTPDTQTSNMTKSTLQLALTVLLTIFTIQFSNSQRTINSNFTPEFRYSKIKKATIKTPQTNFKVYICDIDSSFIYYYTNRKETKKLIDSKCNGCKTYPIEKVESISYQKLSLWGQLTNVLAGFGTVLSTAFLAQKDIGLGASTAVTHGSISATVVACNLLTVHGRAPGSTITKKELNESSYKDSWNYIALKSYEEYQKQIESKDHQLFDFDKLQAILLRRPRRAKFKYLFSLSEGATETGYIVKVSNGLLHLTKNREVLTQLRMDQSDTDLRIDISDIGTLKKL